MNPGRIAVQSLNLSMEEFCRSQVQTLEELERIAPGVPFLALGQTVFWDEPIKAGVIQASRRNGYDRTFVSGIHDTDYFAKLSHTAKKSGYAALPHNDTGTQALWSAAGEFSALFGSETVVTREKLASLGGNVARVAELRPGYLDDITEAWGWRGVVSYDKHSKTTSETSLDRIFQTLFETFEWALQSSEDMVAGEEQKKSSDAADQLRAIACDGADGLEGRSLADYYVRIAPQIYDVIAHEELNIETTRTTELLKFNRATCSLPRFSLLGLFLDPKTRQLACDAYDSAVSGAQMYPLTRFGAGAIPFDVLIPGKGRGTLRLGGRGGVIMMEEQIAFSYKKPIETVERLAEVLEENFAPDVVVVGKAVTMLGMLGREFVFVFHEGASSYVPITREFHKGLASIWDVTKLHPVLRVKYSPWDSMAKCKAWLRLPDVLKRPFGADELSAESFSKRWQSVEREQQEVLDRLSTLKRPLELIEFLDSHVGGQWRCMAQEYGELHAGLAALNLRVGEVKGRRKKVIAELNSLKLAYDKAQSDLGLHWREKIFNKSHSDADLVDRQSKLEHKEEILIAIESARDAWRDLSNEQESIVSAPEVVTAHERRKSIAFEAELTRMNLIREAIIATDGLRRAGYRPSAWWFHLLSPSGCWYKETMKQAMYYLEPLA